MIARVALAGHHVLELSCNTIVAVLFADIEIEDSINGLKLTQAVHEI